MKGLFVVIVVILAVVLAVGLYMGWFEFSSKSTEGKSNITLTVDKDKIQQDKDQAMAAVQDLSQQARDDKVVATTQKAQDETAAGVQPPQIRE
jgi:predicted negative regulator of RcsB-dependent stress response